jgi:hypothetical protein
MATKVITPTITTIKVAVARANLAEMDSRLSTVIS